MEKIIGSINASIMSDKIIFVEKTTSNKELSRFR